MRRQRDKSVAAVGGDSPRPVDDQLRVTMDFYAHLQKQTAAKAARRMDAVLKIAQGVS